MRPNRTRCTGLEHEQLEIHDLEDDSQVREVSDNTASSCLSCVQMGKKVQVNRYRFSRSLRVGPSWISSGESENRKLCRCTRRVDFVSCNAP